MNAPFQIATAAELTALRLQLRANGYRPVPVVGAHVNTKSAGKKPLLTDWQTICIDASEQDIERWSKTLRSSTNTGILGGEVIGLDLDVLDPALSVALAALAVERLGHSPLQRIGREPKTLFCYRLALPIAKIQTPDLFFPDGTKAKVEVLAQGQHFVGFGIHPDTRAPYRWPEKSPLDFPAAELPTVTQELLQAFVTEAEQVLRDAGGRTSAEIKADAKGEKVREKQDQKRERKGGRIIAGLRSGDKPSRELVADALDYVPTDLEYDEWIRIGFALYHGLGDSGADLWESWSSRSSKDDPAFTAKKWASFASGRSITIATLFFIATEKGWRRPSSRQRASEQASTEQGAAAPERRPTIRIAGGNLPAVVSAAEQAIIAANMGLYQRGSLVVRPATTRVAVADGKQTAATRLVPVKSHHIAELMTRAAIFERFDLRSEDWVPIDCPQRVSDVYLARDGQWKLAVLAGVVSCPVLRPDGSILETPGYDAATGLLFDPQGATFSPVPTNPGKDAAADALVALKTLIKTFPFVTDADQSVALSAILTAVHRRSLPTAPLHGFSAPVMGSGKSMLVDVASEIADGRSAAVMALGRTDDEAEKRLGAALIAGDAIVSIDNVDRPFGGELFCQALTQTTLKVRILGLSKLAEVPSNAAMFATGNNLTLAGDMTRRAIMCSLDPGVERPELRKFDRSPLDMVRADRDLYVSAALTILRAFHVAGRPRQVAPIGSFEEWSSWIRDTLIWLGQADPVVTMEKARANDPQLEALIAVTSQWAEVIGYDVRVTVKGLIDSATEQAESVDADNYYSRKPATRTFKHPEFREALLTAAGDGGAINSRRLGRWLGSNQNRLVDGCKLVSDGTQGGVVIWKLIGQA